MRDGTWRREGCYYFFGDYHAMQLAKGYIYYIPHIL